MARTKLIEKQRQKDAAAGSAKHDSGSDAEKVSSAVEKASTEKAGKKDRNYSRKTREKRNIIKQMRELSKRDTFVPFAALTKLIRPIAADAADNHGGNISSSSLRISAGAFEALQEGAEGYVSEILLKANRYARHAKRVTLQPRDLAAVCRDIYEDSGNRIIDVETGASE